MPATSLEERIKVLEAELKEIKQRLDRESSTSPLPWWKKIVGVYRDDPEFEEAVRLGREYRDSLRPSDDEPAD
jgi:hypothetical protein